MKTLIERSLCVGVLAVASCAPTASEQAQQPASAHSQTARALVGNLRGAEARLARAQQPQQMAEYVGHYSAATGRITFEPLLPQGSGGLPRPGYTQLLSNTVSLNDGGSGGNGGTPCGANRICANVTLTNDSSRQIENIRVEVVDLSAGASIVGGDTIDPSYPTSAGSAGGWNYGTLAPGSPNTVPWEFNTGGVEFSFNVRVWGVYTRTSYTAGSRQEISPANNVDAGNATWSDTSPAWRDACLFGSTLFSNKSTFWTAYVAPPFPFTLYETTTDGSTIDAFEISSVGTFSFAQVFEIASNLSLSNASAPDYTLFPFWDDQLRATAGSVCQGVDPTSAAPNRRWVITWKNMTLAPLNTAALTFSMVVQEQSDNVLFLYHRWSSSGTNCTSTGGDPSGASATIGARGNGVSQSTTIGYLSPVLGSHARSCPDKGSYFRLTATPANP
ncbi:MAG: hypothetical protein U0269_22615 [Polyangiales bacterium]